MKNLTLSIQREFFDDILAGVKKNEYREVKPTNIKNYLVLDEENNPIFKDETSLDLEVVNYDTLTLYTGQYKGKRPGIIVQCLGAKTFVDKKNTYIHNGEELCRTYIEYQLGEIIEKLNFENLTPSKNIGAFKSIHSPEKHKEIDANLAIKNKIDREKKDERNKRLNSLIKGKVNISPKHSILKK